MGANVMSLVPHSRIELKEESEHQKDQKLNSSDGNLTAVKTFCCLQ